jgi:hypothetical protein
MKVLSTSFVVLIPLLLSPFYAGVSSLALGADEAPAKVKYKAGKDVNFEELLIKGELSRPEITVVTGQVDKGTDGLLKLRENFLDRVASDQGEEAQ